MMAITYGLLGLGLGAMYSLASQGLILIYRGSGVLNFAQGAIGMVGAYVEYEVAVSHGAPYLVGLGVGVGSAALLGLLTHLLIMRQLRRASPLARIVATLGVLITLQAATVIEFGSTARFVPTSLPGSDIRFGGGVSVPEDRFYLLGIALALTVALWGLYRYTRFGIATSAVAENQRAAASLGWSPDVIAAINWALGSGLAGLAAILVTPIVTLQITILTNLVLAALAAALVAQFRSFPIAFVAAVVIGVVETEMVRYVTQPGLPQSVPFIIIIVVMVVRGQAIPLRDFFLQRLPKLGSGRIRPVRAAVACVVAVVLLTTTSAGWVDAISYSMATALVLLSIVVLTGYTGQLSLAQYAIAGFGAWVAGHMVMTDRWPFAAAAAVGVLAAVPLGVLFVLPAARTRGINFAVVTLGLGQTLELMLFDNGGYTGRSTQVGSPTLWGLDVGEINHPSRYGLMVLAVLVACCLMVTNLRRGRSGRRLIAVRTNERAAAALGVRILSAKLYAFAVGAALAAAGGILLAFSNPTITYTDFTNFTSITDIGWAMIGGVGYVVGPIYGSVLADGGVASQITNTFLSGLDRYLTLLGGVLLILLVLRNQDGMGRETARLMDWLTGRTATTARGRGRRLGRARPPVAAKPLEAADPQILEVRGLTVRYGATTAVDDVSLTVTPGRVLGLIGPNGAGKTSLIDAVTGFTKPSCGHISLGGRRVDHWSVVRRARAGMSRSFQSLELFEDSSVIDNLRVGCDPPGGWCYLGDLIYPVQPPLPAAAAAAIEEFGLGDDLSRQVQDLPYGKRRLLAIARAVASQPRVLLLDEPAAGLGDVESRELAVLIRRLASDWGIGVLVVEHDMNFVMALCDELVVLDFGRVIGRGTPDEVRSNDLVVAAYLGAAAEEGEIVATSESALDGE